MLDFGGLPGVITITHEGRAVATTTGGGCTLKTTFQIASVSKNLASTLTMMLVEAGMLDLHEPLAHWLPEAPPSWDGVSLHHLLSNCSGIGHWTEVPGLQPSVPATQDERLRLVLSAPLQFEPGARFHYSSPAFLIVGVVVERAAGKPYGQLLAEKILKPLEMKSTSVGSRPRDAVPGHHDGEPVESWDLASMIGSGDLWSTTEDLVGYAHALNAGALVSPDSLALMRYPHSTLTEPDRTPDGRLVLTNYGYGHYVGVFDGQPAALHTGDNPGYKSLIGWLPDGYGIVGISNDDSIQWEGVLAQLLQGRQLRQAP